MKILLVVVLVLLAVLTEHGQLALYPLLVAALLASAAEES